MAEMKEIPLFLINSNYLDEDDERWQRYNFNQFSVRRNFLRLMHLLAKPSEKSLKGELMKFIKHTPKNQVWKGHNKDVNNVFPRLLDCINYFQHLDHFTQLTLSGNNNHGISKSCLCDFLGLLWMKTTGYYEPIRYIRNAIAHGQIEWKKGDNKAVKILLYNITDDGKVDWKLFCDQDKFCKNAITFLEKAADLLQEEVAPIAAPEVKEEDEDFAAPLGD